MRTKIQHITQIIVIAFFLSIVTNLVAANKPDVLIGKKAPQISGKKAVGRGIINLNKLMSEVSYAKDKNGKFKEVNGKFVLTVTKNVVVLNFFSTTCIPCIKEIPTYNLLARKFKNRPVKMIYVNIDHSVDDLEITRFVARRQIKVPMMLPNQRDAIKKYKAFSLPRMVIINRQGIIDHIITGFNENLESELTHLIERLLI